MLSNNINKNLGQLQAHPFHLVSPSPWPIFFTFSVSGTLFNLVMLFNNYINDSYIFILNIITLLYCGLLWGKDIIAEATYLGHHTAKVSKGISIGYLLFLFTELLTFAGVFWAYFHSALTPNIEIGELWPPLGITAIQATDLPLLNTLILLASGATITYSHHGLIGKSWSASVYGLLFTIILGILFIICQYIEYTLCTYTIADSVYGTVFFALTGLHGFHLFLGVFFLILSFYRLYTLQMTTTHHTGYSTTILLWHFLDVMWLFVYIVCYYWGV